jgi:hypothetical protein
MARSAHVTSLAALAEFRANLGTFVEEGREALSANEMEIQRAFTWLEEKFRYWKKELYDRQEAVVTAKQNLASRKMFKTFGKPPDCTEQEKALRLAQRRLEEAEEKLANCKKWGPLLRRHVDEYESQARCLAGMLEADMPRALTTLEEKIAALEAYVGMAPPESPGVGEAAPVKDEDFPDV